VTRADKLRSLAAKAKTPGRALLTEEEGREAIAAYHRGVSLDDIGAAFKSSRGSIYARIGSWALRHCACYQERKPKVRGDHAEKA